MTLNKPMAIYDWDENYITICFWVLYEKTFQRIYVKHINHLK
jgi:hypothetical protein